MKQGETYQKGESKTIKLALDTNIISSMLNGEETAITIAKTLNAYNQKGHLLICGLVYAELLIYYPRQKVEEFLRRTNIAIDFFLSQEIWITASSAWEKYLIQRKKHEGKLYCPYCGHENAFICSFCGQPLKEPKNLLADFIVGAHALHKADMLFSLDKRGKFYRRYFIGLKILTIGESGVSC